MKDFASGFFLYQRTPLAPVSCSEAELIIILNLPIYIKIQSLSRGMANPMRLDFFFLRVDLQINGMLWSLVSGP
jgi:hypothetical protein